MLSHSPPAPVALILTVTGFAWFSLGGGAIAPAWQQLVAEFRRFLPGEAQDAGAFGELTDRERQVLELIARGLDNEQIALTLRLSEKTVGNHITRIFAKTGVGSRAQAIVRAREAGFGQARSLH